MDLAHARELLRDRPLPAALVDLDAVGRNARTLLDRLAPGRTLRVASKSVRHVGLLRRILALDPRISGLLCYSVPEAAWLRQQGFDDVLVAYPTVQRSALRALASAGGTARVVVDAAAHVDALAAVAAEQDLVLDAVIEVDTSWRPAGGAVHVGARRSPIRSAADALALARHARATGRVRIAGIMAYEAHVAGVQDDSPFARATNRPKRWMKRLAMPHVTRLRSEVVAALRADGFELSLVNGGGTGSVGPTSEDPVVTEVAAGSGFLCPHLFSYFAGLPLEPAAWFALEVCRSSDPGLVTCAGGGYVASGEPGWDRLPLPVVPPGLTYLGLEGAGEVQTPLRSGAETPVLAVGDPVLFRHAKAGELAERFATYLLLEGGRVVAEEPTYRGQGACFG